jgi:hypothetical protein
MRNLEYALYAIFFVYLYKFFDVIFILLGASDYADFVIPETFMPLGILILTLHFLLLILTILAFKYRKELVGSYNFDEINGQIDSWE